MFPHSNVCQFAQQQNQQNEGKPDVDSGYLLPHDYISIGQLHSLMKLPSPGVQQHGHSYSSGKHAPTLNQFVPGHHAHQLTHAHHQPTCQQSGGMPNQPHHQQQQPFQQFPMEQQAMIMGNVRRRLVKPWWMWIIGISEIALVVFFTYRVVANLIYNNDSAEFADRQAVMWGLFLVAMSLTIQFVMGAALLVGLFLSEDEEALLGYAQMWICGAYILLLNEAAVFLFNVFGSVSTLRLAEIVGSLSFRIITFLIIKRYLNNSRSRKFQSQVEQLTGQQGRKADRACPQMTARCCESC